MINERSRAFRRLSSRALFRSDADRRHSARNGFDVERGRGCGDKSFRRSRIIDFRLSRFLEQARRSRDAGVDIDAAWRNQPLFAGWTIVRIFRYCRVSLACKSRESNLATCEPPTCRIVVAISLVSRRVSDPSEMNANVHVAITCFLLVTLMALTSGQLMSKEHRTHAASERANDLWCYQCFTMDHGERCINLNYSSNFTTYHHKCKDDRRICMVKRFSYTTSTENSTSSPKTWSLERNCTNKCEPGCIVIGERTKLYACTACCETNLCNNGTGTANDLTIKEIDLLLALVLEAVLTVIMYPS